MKKAQARRSGRSARDVKVDRVWNAAWWFLLSVIILTVICLGVTFWASKELTADRIAERKFDEMAAEYYENYLYPTFVERNPGELEEVFARYAETGFGVVRLRQMLNRVEVADTDNDARTYFKNATIDCDTDNSTVIFVPVAPFGKTDYTTKVSLVCE